MNLNNNSVLRQNRIWRDLCLQTQALVFVNAAWVTVRWIRFEGRFAFSVCPSVFLVRNACVTVRRAVKIHVEQGEGRRCVDESSGGDSSLPWRAFRLVPSSLAAGTRLPRASPCVCGQYPPQLQSVWGASYGRGTVRSVRDRQSVEMAAQTSSL